MHNLSNVYSQSFEKIVDNFFRKVEYGNIKISFPSNKILNFNGNNQGIYADIKLNNFFVFRKIVQKGAVGFAESYMDGDFSTSNLTNLLIFAEQNESFVIDHKQGKWFYKISNTINHFLNQNTKSKSQKNISYHYDLGNKFYELWLDQSMSYSSGFFTLPSDDLSKAQINKYKKNG